MSKSSTAPYAYAARAECTRRGKHLYVFDSKPRQGKTTRNGHHRWHVLGVCRICGDRTFRRAKPPRFVPPEPYTQAADHHAMRLIAQAGARFVPIETPGYSFPPLPWKKSKANDLTLHDLLADEDYTTGKKNYAVLLARRQRGVFAIDVDSDTALARCRDKEGWREDTLTIESPRGYHFFWRLPKDYVLGTKHGTSRLGKGVDVQSKGAYVVGPGGERTSMSYQGKPGPSPKRLRYRTIEAPETIPECPPELLHLLAYEVEPSPPDAPPSPPAPDANETPQPGTPAIAPPTSTPLGAAKGAIRPYLSGGRWFVARYATETVIVGQRDDHAFSATVNELADLYPRLSHPPPRSHILALLDRRNAKLRVPLDHKQVHCSAKVRTCLNWWANCLRWRMRFGGAGRRYTPEQRSRGGKKRALQQIAAAMPRSKKAYRMRQAGCPLSHIASTLGMKSKSTAHAAVARGHAALASEERERRATPPPRLSRAAPRTLSRAPRMVTSPNDCRRSQSGRRAVPDDRHPSTHPALVHHPPRGP